MKSIQEHTGIGTFGGELDSLNPMFMDPVTGVRVEMVDITPNMAAEWLGKNNTHNRNLRRRTLVQPMVRDMEEGDWKQIGDTICFSDRGVLLDGQHRLEAIQRSGKTQRYIVVFGLPLTAQRLKDIGAKRLFSDDLTLAGEINTMVLAAIITKCYLWEKGQYRFDFRKMVPSRPELVKFFEEHQDSLRETARAINAVRGIASPPVQPSILGLCHWLFNQIDADTCDLFFEKWKSGASLEEGHPILTLRKRVLAERTKVSKLPPVYWTAFIIKTWNAFVDNEPLIQLSFRPGGAKPEKMPLPRGYNGNED